MSETSRAFIFTFLFALIARGASGAASTLTLKDALTRARDNSPDVRQLGHQYASARERAWLALAPAEPSVNLTDNDLAHGFRLETAGSQTLTLTQPIGFPGRAWLQRAQARDLAEQIAAQRDAAVASLDVNVKTAYFNWQQAHDNVRLNDETARAFGRVLEISRRRYEAGATAQIDVLNAQIALLQNENDLADLKAAEQTSRAQLLVYLGEKNAAPYEPEPLRRERRGPINRDQALREAGEKRHEVRAAKLGAAAASTAYKLAWASLLPDFQLTVGTTNYRETYGSPYSGDPAYASGDPSWPSRTYSVGLQFTIPLWFMFNERAAIAGASEDRAAANRAVDIQLNQTRLSLESLARALDAADEKIARFEERILPLAEQSFKLALTAYSSGRIDFQALSDTATAQRQTRASYHAAIVSYLTNYAGYEQLLGGAVAPAL